MSETRDPSDTPSGSRVGRDSQPSAESAEKLELVLQLLRGVDAEELAKSSGRPKSQLLAWKRRFLEGGRHYLSSRQVDDEKLREDNRTLRLRVEELTKLRAKLERATATDGANNGGRQHPNCRATYAKAFEGPGVELLHVPEWGTHVLLRQGRLATGPLQATGLLPHASLDPACDLSGGLRRIAERGVASISLVTDPMWCPPLEQLQRAFDRCRPFKLNHYMDREAGNATIRKRHRNRANNAKLICDVRQVDFRQHLEDWWRMYSAHVQLRKIRQPFSRSYFERLGEMEELEALAAFAGDEPVTLTLWLKHESAGTVYFHDAVSTPRGHEIHSSHAVFAAALDRFRSYRVLFLGGAVGIHDSDSEGLSEFKRGFANASAQSYLCSSTLARR